MNQKKKDQVIFGIHAVTEALDAGRELEKVLIRGSRGTSDLLATLRSRLIAEKVPFQHVPAEKLNSITMKNHQGVIAYVSEIVTGRSVIFCRSCLSADGYRSCWCSTR
jgi:23S rRNA (guanosine2251-2'-O)-methyltransferase